jgi:hypothetical protein
MKQIHVVHKQQEWVGETEGQIVCAAETKKDAVRLTVEFARSLGEPVSVRIHNRDGTIQEERSYPRRTSG